MGTGEVFSASIVELSKKISNKQISPVEVVEAFIRKIEQYNPKINAFCTIASDEALAAAQEAENKLVLGEKSLPLQGIPLAIKDLTPTKGIRTTFGSKVYAKHIPDWDACFVRRVKQAGAIIIGKTNTPEFGHTGITDNLLFGRTNNPWDVTKTAGGSSGGSAAAVAAGLVPAAEGSDGGGSIRIPASACGVFGFKPTYGRIPFDSAPTRFSSNTPFLHHGTITRTVEDAALLLDIVKGPDKTDPYSLPDTHESFYPIQEVDLKNWKVAYSPNLDYFEIDREVKEAVAKAAGSLAGMGCQVEEVVVGLSDGEELVTKTFIKLWAVYYAAFYQHLLSKWSDQMSKSFIATIKPGQNVSAVDYKGLERSRSKVLSKIEQIFSKYDLLITPTLAVPAFPHGPGPSTINGRSVNPYTGWMLTSVFNLTGHPVASINCGYSADGMPIGLQIVGPRFSEKRVFEIAKAFESDNPNYFKFSTNLD